MSKKPIKKIVIRTGKKAPKMQDFDGRSKGQREPFLILI